MTAHTGRRSVFVASLLAGAVGIGVLSVAVGLFEWKRYGWWGSYAGGAVFALAAFANTRLAVWLSQRGARSR